MEFKPELSFANEMDASDPMAHFRDRFNLVLRENQEPEIYLCGNSLGLQPKSAEDYVKQELQDWKSRGVKGHFSGERPWMPYHEFLTEKSAELVGALPDEVINMNSLTVNLHLMMVSFYRPTKNRYRILLEKPAFPSDRYAVESQVRYHGYDESALIEIGPRDGEHFIREDDLYSLIEEQGDSIALILLPGVQYYSGQYFDLKKITEVGQHKGCVIGFDLAHAAGNLPLHLHDWNVDFACWCSYKYLNSGPGAVAGCFVHQRHASNTDLPRFAGWWGHDKSSRFQMGPEFRPIPTAEGWQLSNPPILALTPVMASLEIFAEAGMGALRKKSVQLTAYLEYLLNTRVAKTIEIITPTNPEQRGCQLSLRVRGGDPELGRRMFKALETDGVTCDWREPDVIRIAPVPLYNKFSDVHRFVEILERTSAA